MLTWFQDGGHWRCGGRGCFEREHFPINPPPPPGGGFHISLHEMWWLIGSVTDYWGSGPGFESGISHRQCKTLRTGRVTVYKNAFSTVRIRHLLHCRMRHLSTIIPMRCRIIVRYCKSQDRTGDLPMSMRQKKVLMLGCHKLNRLLLHGQLS